MLNSSCSLSVCPCERVCVCIPGVKSRCLLQDEPDTVPLIVLDECHKAKNLITDTGVPTLCGKAVEFLQRKCPNAAVLYSSATGISEPTNMAYMVRIGTCGYDDMVALIEDLKAAGLGASELFSCTLKAQGVYLARCVMLGMRCAKQ
jgi:hypothetical protein